MSGPANSDDERRFTQIFETCHAAVLAYVRRRIAADAAQDVVADTFLAAWRNLDAVPSASLPWLYRAASFEIGHARRKLDQDHWASAFRELSEADKEVLRLVAWEGVSPAEGAFVFECSVTTFKVRLHRARRRLVRLLDKDEAGDAPRDAAEIALGRPAGDPPPLYIRADQAAVFADLAHRTIQEECP
jgi:RNA polymerase sigma-70 factor (ECF subfamily)